MANIIKKGFFSLVEKAFTQEAYVTGAKKWDPANFYEIDLLMPGTDMTKWNTIPRIKCKVAEFEFRDYSPAFWDAEKKTCTILIDAGHAGHGSTWAQDLKPGDQILFSPAHAAHLPSVPGKILCIGDASALGHFLALRQLTNAHDHQLEIMILQNDQCTIPVSFAAGHPELELIPVKNTNSTDQYHHLYENKILADYTTVYLAGYIPMVTGIRKILKKDPQLNARIFAHGFWS